MKTTIFEAVESLRALNNLREQRLPGKLALKIYDATDVLMKKAEFLDQETHKLSEQYKAFPADPENNDNRLVVKNDDGTINDAATKSFTDEVIELRKTEVELDIKPITEEDLDLLDLSPVDVGLLRYMIEV